MIPNHKYNHKYPGKDADIYCDIFLSCQWRFSKTLNFLPPLAFWDWSSLLSFLWVHCPNCPSLPTMSCVHLIFKSSLGQLASLSSKWGGGSLVDLFFCLFGSLLAFLLTVLFLWTLQYGPCHMKWQPHRFRFKVTSEPVLWSKGDRF